jgi:hypothetical protein
MVLLHQDHTACDWICLSLYLPPILCPASHTPTYLLLFLTPLIFQHLLFFRMNDKTSKKSGYCLSSLAWPEMALCSGQMTTSPVGVNSLSSMSFLPLPTREPWIPTLSPPSEAWYWYLGIQVLQLMLHRPLV